MRKFAILLDSTCDMEKVLMDRFDLDYCQMGISIDDKEYPASLTWEDFTPHEFYDLMRKGKRVYTVQITHSTYETKFSEYLEQGMDVLYIACSSGLSASINVARLVAEELMKKYEGSKIICIDSLISGMGQGLIGIRASELRAAGRSIDEIAEEIEKEKLRYNQWGAVGNLTYLKNAGRVTASAAFFGNLFGVKPILISDIEGHNFAYKKVKGRKNSIQELADSVERTIQDSEDRYIAITHADDVESALEVKKLIEEKGLKYKEILISNLGPILGASCGPDTLVAYNFGEEVTIKGE